MKERVWIGLTLAAAVLAGGISPMVKSAQRVQPVSVQLPADAKYVALTFDDGPREKTTGPLLEGLAQRGVKATFFLIGSQAQQCPDLVKEMARQGHQLGLHTWSHVSLAGLNGAAFRREMTSSRSCLEELAGPENYMLRPPYGFVSTAAKRWAGTAIIRWSVDTEDWKDKNAARIVAQISREAADGAIILMHDIYPTSVEAALKSVDMLRAQGYYFVTVEELFQLRGVEPQPGEVYDCLPP